MRYLRLLLRMSYKNMYYKKGYICADMDEAKYHEYGNCKLKDVKLEEISRRVVPSDRG